MENQKNGKFAGKVVIITGAATGIGRSTALELIAEGARVGITDINANALEETAEMIKNTGGEVIAIVGDIVEAETIDILASKVVEAFGRIDGLVNNAGIVMGKPILEHTKEDFDKIVGVNTWSYLLTAKRVVPEMQKNGKGSVVNVASVGASVAIPQLGVYCTSKAAVLGLTRSMAYDLGPEIRVNAISPGGVLTPMAEEDFANYPSREAALEVRAGEQIQKRYADPEELAKGIVFLLSEGSSFMTGSEMKMDGGWTAW